MVYLIATVEEEMTPEEPMQLPEGAEADVVVLGADPHEEMDEQERAELLRAIDDGLAAGDAGDETDFDDYLASRRARRG